MKWKIPKHSDLIMTDPWELGKTMPAEFEKARKEANKYDLHLDPDNMLKERVKWLEAENKRLEQTNTGL